MKQTSRKKVIILGGGYAGILAALRLSRKTNPRQVDITLINGQELFVERIRFHQQAANQELKSYSITNLLAGSSVNFIQGWVTRLDPKRQQVLVRTSKSDVELNYDYAVYALGSIVETTLVPGVSQNAFSLSTTSTTRRLKNLLPGVAAAGGTLLVCGGGLTGIEAASELAETYPNLKVKLVTAETFGDQLSQKGQRYLQQAFERRGITVESGKRITAVHPDHIQTDNGTTIPFDICLWAGSFRAPNLAREAGLPVNNRGQIFVDEHLRAKGYPTLYAIGDAASLEEAIDVPIRMGCVTAAPMGTYVGNHLATVIRGDKFNKPYHYRYFIRCISLGRKDGLVQFVTAEDIPKERILTGGIGSKVKEIISSSSVWNIQMEQKLVSFFTRTRSESEPIPTRNDLKEVSQL